MIRVWLKLITTQVGRPGLCAAGSAKLVLLTLGGLYALAPLDYEPPQPKFFLCLVLLSLFWIGWVALTVSFNCWIISMFSSEKLANRLHRPLMFDYKREVLRSDAEQSIIALNAARKGG
jgi:hypothetical protein